MTLCCSLISSGLQLFTETDDPSVKCGGTDVFIGWEGGANE